MRTPYMEGEPSAKMARQAANDVLESYAFGDSDEERYTDDDT